MKSKKILAVILSMVLLLTPMNTVAKANSSEAPASGALVKNAGFEDGSNNWEDWGNTEIETTEVHTGAGAIKIGTDEGGMGQVINGISANTSYELSGWGKVSAVSGSAILGVDCLDSNSQKIPGGKFTVTFSKTEYEKLAKEFTTPDGTASIQIYVYKNSGSDYAYLDDLSITAANLLENGDFEAYDSLNPALIDSWEDWGNTTAEALAGCDGSAAARMGTDEGGVAQYIGNISAGDKFTLSGFGKVTTEGDVAILAVKCLDSSGKVISGSTLTIEFTGTDYESKSADFTAVTGTDKLMVYIYDNGSASYVYVDNLSLSLVSKADDSQTDASGTLVKNAGFEDGKNSWEDWGNTEIEATEVHTGAGAIKIGADEGGMGQIINGISANKAYELSGWGKVNTEGEAAVLGVDCFDSNGQKISGGKFTLTFSKTDYEKLTKEFTTPEGTASIQIYVYKNPGSGYAYLDDLSIAPANLVENGDFEASDTEITGWEQDPYNATSGMTAVVCADTESGREGNTIRIGKDSCGAMQIIDDAAANTEYTLSGYGRVSALGENGWFGAVCLDSNGTKLKQFGTSFTSTDYAEKTVTFTTVAGTASIRIFLWKDGPNDGGKDAYAYYDDISLTKGASGSDNDAADIYTPQKGEAFYDDFTDGISSANWLIAKTQWGGTDANGGVIPKNVSVKDGIVTIAGNGDLYTGGTKGINSDLTERSDGKRTGGAIATKYSYASGSYEVRAKILPNVGACSGFRTYFNNGTLNHEIDLEVPGEESISKITATSRITEDSYTSETVDTVSALSTEQGIADGEWHTFRFDWHTDSANPRVEYYIDGKLISTNTANVPTAAGRFWIGVWFPQTWAGVADFDTSNLQIDWVRITPFDESGDQLLPGHGGSWADLTEYPNSSETPDSSKAVNTHNIVYISIPEMNEKRAFTEEGAIEGFVNQMKNYSIEYQFCDMGALDGNGKLTVSNNDDILTRQWIAISKSICPEQKIIATINGDTSVETGGGEALRQTIANECKRLIDTYGFDGIQVDLEPFRVEYNANLVDLLSKIKTAIGEEKHLSIATTASETYLPDKDITAIANAVDMIDIMNYDSNGPEVATAEEYIQYCKNSILRYSNAIANSNNTDCQLISIMPVYEQKGYTDAPGWPDASSSLVIYHLPSVENIQNAAQGIRQAINDGAKVYGSGIFWWGCFTNVQFDSRDGQDYAKDRQWWINDWVQAKPDVIPTVPPTAPPITSPTEPTITPTVTPTEAPTPTPVISSSSTSKRRKDGSITQVTNTVLHYTDGHTTSVAVEVVTDKSGKQVSATATVSSVPVVVKAGSTVTFAYDIPGDLLKAEAEKLAEGTKLTVTCNLPEKELLSQINNAAGTYNVVISQAEVFRKDNIELEGITLSKEVLTALKAQGGKLTVTLQSGGHDASWIFDGEALKDSKAKLSGLNLAVDVINAKDHKAGSDILKEDKNNSKGIVVDVKEDSILPAQARMRVYIGAELNSEYVYAYGIGDGGEMLSLPNNRYKIDSEGYITINIIQCRDYIIVPHKASSDAVFSLLEQVSADSKVTVAPGKKATLKIKIPSSLQQVSSFDGISESKDSAIRAAKITYAVSNSLIASVDTKGVITAKKAGTVTVTTTVTLINGKKKTYTSTVIVK